MNPIIACFVLMYACAGVDNRAAIKSFLSTENKPPIEVLNGPGFEWQHEQSLRARAEFFKTHELVEGKWILKGGSR